MNAGLELIGEDCWPAAASAGIDQRVGQERAAPAARPSPSTRARRPTAAGVREELLGRTHTILHEDLLALGRHMGRIGMPANSCPSGLVAPVRVLQRAITRYADRARW